MKTGVKTIIIGIGMFVSGLILFYSIETSQTDSILRIIKSMGTFVGLSGIGVVLAGLLVFLINRNTSIQNLQENIDPQV